MSAIPILSLGVPLPPSANRIWRVAGRRIILSDEARAWREAAEDAIRRQLPPGWRLLSGPLEIWVTSYVPTLSSDANNRVKSLEDACNGLVWEDDRQVGRAVVTKRFSAGREPWCRLDVLDLDDAELAERLEAAAERKAKTKPRSPLIKAKPAAKSKAAAPTPNVIRSR